MNNHPSTQKDNPMAENPMPAPPRFEVEDNHVTVYYLRAIDSLLRDASTNIGHVEAAMNPVVGVEDITDENTRTIRLRLELVQRSISVAGRHLWDWHEQMDTYIADALEHGHPAIFEVEPHTWQVIKDCIGRADDDVLICINSMLNDRRVHADNTDHELLGRAQTALAGSWKLADLYLGHQHEIPF